MKHLNPVWKYFDRNASNRQNVKAICKACKKEQQGIVERMEKHVTQCTKIDKIKIKTSYLL